VRPLHGVRLRHRRDGWHMHTHGEGVRQEHGLSRVRGRGAGVVQRERVSDQQRRLYADLH